MRSEADPEQLTEHVAAHLESARFASLDERTLGRAKQRVLDSIGNIAAGRRATGSSSVLELLARWGGASEATMLTTSTRLPAPHAAFANAMLMRSFDFEAIGADSPSGAQIPSHITGSTVAVALAVAEARESSGEELLTALVYGDDLAARLGHATGFDVYGGDDNTGTINAFGAVATAGVLMGLDRRQFRDALGLVLNQLGGTIANVFDKVPAFKLPIALSARNAVFSAELAAAGFGGPLDAIGGRFGYFDRYGRDADASRLTDGLGEVFFADAAIKPWPSCRASHPMIDGVLRIVRAEHLRPDEIDTVRLHVTPRTRAGFVGAPFEVGESPEVSGAFSIRFTAATALLEGDVALRHMNEAYMRSAGVRQMMARIDLVDSLPPTESLTAEVEIVTRGGRTLRSRVDYPLGDLHFNPLPEGAVLEKFRSNMQFAGYDEDVAAKVSSLVDSFESLRVPGENVARLLTK